jgi:hypothetical protein
MEREPRTEQEANEQATRGEQPKPFNPDDTATNWSEPRTLIPDAKAAAVKVDKPEQTERGKAMKESKSAYVPHIILGVIALLSIAALAAMAYAPGTETQFIQNTLGSIALAATAALAGIIKGPGT